jgi:hypothetical protein
VSLRYEDALDAAIAAVRHGEPIDAVIARSPEHGEALRNDLRLTAAVRTYASTISPAAEARADANQRLMVALQSERTAEAKSVDTRPWWSAGLPRFAIAAALVVIAFAAFAALDRGNGPTVEAATIEGVVLGSGDGSLTVQTLDALEEVAVPADAAISDASGATIALAGIEPGEVVLIQAQRRGDRVVAQQVDRLVANIEAWCNDASERCEVLTDRLRNLERSCEDRPGACRVTLREVNQLRERASDTARLEALKTRCRTGEQAACEELAGFCREHPGLCAYIAPNIPAPTTEMRERIQQLVQSCQKAEVSACRQLAQLCQDHPGACPNAPRINPTRSSTDPVPTVRPPSDVPTVAPARPPATPVTQREPTSSTDRTR